MFRIHFHCNQKIARRTVDELVFSTVDVGDVHVVGGRREIFELLAGEDLSKDEKLSVNISLEPAEKEGKLTSMAIK